MAAKAQAPEIPQLAYGIELVSDDLAADAREAKVLQARCPQLHKSWLSHLADALSSACNASSSEQLPEALAGTKRPANAGNYQECRAS